MQTTEITDDKIEKKVSKKVDLQPSVVIFLFFIINIFLDVRRNC